MTAQTEQQRTPLAGCKFNEPRTPFDRFTDMVVTRGGYLIEGAAMAKQQGPFQRMTAEADPLHGSAFLRD